MAQIEEEKKVVDKEREEMLANFEKHKELERQQQEKIRKVCLPISLKYRWYTLTSYCDPNP